MNFRILFLLLPLCLAAASCGGTKNPHGRVDVTGAITFNGQPFPFSGGVFFDPVEGNKTDGGVSQILQGKIDLTGQNAPKPGKYIVRISGTDYYDRTTKQPVTPQTAPGNDYAVKVIPEDFNVNSKIEFEVVAGTRNVFNYDIVTDYKPQPVK